MPVYEHNFFSIVLLGNPNPVIINHDFMISNEIIPREADPFKVLLQKEPGKQFSEFFSTPDMTFLRYDKISFLVDKSRYQVKDEENEDLTASPITQITKKLFGEILKYTPFQASGINFNGRIVFDNEEEKLKHFKSLGFDLDPLNKVLAQENIFIGLLSGFAHDLGKCELFLREPKAKESFCNINFNVERKSDSIHELLAPLDNILVISDLFRSILSRMNVE